jgi:hypothetical protein
MQSYILKGKYMIACALHKIKKQLQEFVFRNNNIDTAKKWQIANSLTLI